MALFSFRKNKTLLNDYYHIDVYVNNKYVRRWFFQNYIFSIFKVVGGFFLEQIR
jgi:hypothetical protein